MSDLNQKAKLILEGIIEARSFQNAENLARFLHGSKSKKIIQHQLNLSASYGRLLSEDISYKETLNLIQQLIKADLIYENHFSNLTVLSVSKTGLDFLYGLKPYIKIKEGSEEKVKKDSNLMLELRNYRTFKAKELDRPPYMIFDNKVLSQLDSIRPKTKEAFLKINGIGPSKWEAFGQDILDMIIREGTYAGAGLDTGV